MSCDRPAGAAALSRALICGPFGRSLASFLKFCARCGEVEFVSGTVRPA